jgi:hypothetical protein
MRRSATYRPPLNASAAFAEIEARRISLVPCFGGRVWVASVERVKTRKRFTKPELETISAQASTSLDAVAALVRKIETDVAGASLAMEEKDLEEMAWA